MQSLTFTYIFLISLMAVSCTKFHKTINTKDKDVAQKAIVFDKMTPDVFYCPTQKVSTMKKLIVRARPLYKLCEFEGKPLPADYKSDCYNDIDETDYACKEKFRIMKRIIRDEATTSYI